MSSQPNARQRTREYNPSYRETWQSNEINSASPTANRPRVSNTLNQLPITDSHATARTNLTNVPGQPQWQTRYGGSSSPPHGYGSPGSGGSMEPQVSMIATGHMAPRPPWHSTPTGWEVSREPSHANNTRSQYNSQLYNSTRYPQPLNSFPEQNQSIPYSPAPTPTWPEPPQQVYQRTSFIGTSFRDESSYAEHNPSPNTDPDGMKIGTRYGRLISSTEGGRQQLDPSFKVKEDPWKFFTPGRVFKLYWAAPRGSNAPQSEPEGSVFNCGPHVYAKIQRFVVVKPDHSQGYSYCLPISTNGGKGAAKKGLRQEEHTIVYTSAEAPLKLESETRLHKNPIKIDPVDPSEKLDPCSRLNLGKFYPVEHNPPAIFQDGNDKKVFIVASSTASADAWCKIGGAAPPVGVKALFWGTSGARLEVNPGGNVASNIWHETIAGSNFVMAQILEVIACLKQLIGNPG